jgi:hypothetical protein
MISVRMSDDDAVEPIDLRREKLLAKVRAAVDEDTLASAFSKDRGAQPVVSRVRGIALAPFVADLRDAGRCPAT